ncbi:lactonase family protein [Novosphingobium sp. BL-8A]|uniref:lactonase family protein n=1 Tax=Novosphingobium sp. BL-8A TaxID=3127639 RepID=UPI003757FA90
MNTRTIELAASRRAVLGGLALGGLAMTGAGRALASSAPASDALVYFGMHGSQIHAARFDTRRGTLSPIGVAAEQSAPTWGILHPAGEVVYYVREDGNEGWESGAVVAYRIDRTSGRLQRIGETIAQGGGTTHLHLDAPSMTLLATNFGGSTVSTIPIRSDDGLGPVSSVLIEHGSGPMKRQGSSHPHGVAVDPTGRFALVPDLGADRIFVHRFDRQTRALRYDRPDRHLDYVAAPGSGPRHVLFHPGGRVMFALTELSGELLTFGWNGETGELTLIDARSTSSAGFSGERSSSELAISADGTKLYLTDRSENTIVVHAIDPATGKLTLLQRLSCGGDFPWHFAIDPAGSWMLVANEKSSRVEVFAIDRASGRVSPTRNGLDLPRPVHILFAGEIA